MTEWFPSLPPGWETIRLDRVAQAWPSNVDKHTVEGQPTVRLCNYTDVYRNQSITPDLNFMPASATPAQVEKFRLRVGDTLITKDSETADDIGIPAFVEYEADDLICGYHLAMIRPRESRILPRFLYWVLESEPTMRQWSLLATGVTRVGIKSNDLSRLELALPPIRRQAQLAHYLDRETAQIDTLISEQQRMRGLLSERRRGLIERWVFGWHAAQKADFGYPWLPPLPIHWSTPSIGQVCETLAGWAFRSEGFTDDSNAIRLLRGVNVKVGRIDWSDMVAWNQEAHPVPEDFVLQEGDLVFGMDRPFVSTGVRVAAVTPADLPAYLVQRVMRIRPGADLDAAYLAFLMETDSFNSYLAPLFTGVSVPHVSEWQVRKFRIPLPPLDEQHSAVRSLRREIEIIEQLDQEADTLIRLARERRAALITAAVTGQIEIPEAS